MTDSTNPPQDNSGFGSGHSGPPQSGGGYQPPTYDSGQSDQYGQPYGQQGYGGGATGTNGLAIAALVVGILALLTFWTVLGGIVLGIAGIILGVMGMSKAKQLNGSGKGMAIGGLVTAALGLLLTVLMIAGIASVFDFGPGGEVLIDGTPLPTPPG